MFACFGKKNKKKEKKKKSSSKKDHPDEDEDNPSSINNNTNKNRNSNLNSDDEREHLEEELTKLKIDKENLSFSNENNQRLLNFIDSLIRDFKTNFSIHFDDDDEDDDNANNDKPVSIMKFIKKEKSSLETKLELLSSDYAVLQSQYKSSYDEFERLTDPVHSQKEKLEQRKFVLTNLLQQKNNFLRFLEMKQSAIKKSKKTRNSIVVDDIFLNNNQGTYQGLLNKIHASEIAQQQNESSLNNDSFEKESEYGGGYKDSDAHKETIRKLINENVEYSRMTYQKVYKQTIEENEKYVKNIKLLSMLKNVDDAGKGVNAKNSKEKENANVNANVNANGKKKKEDEKELKMKQEELMKKQNTINELLVEIETVKSANTSLEKEIGEMYEELSTKFKTSIKLEKQLEKIKAAKKKLMATKNINNK